MAEELKSLLDRIQKDGVDKAEEKAAEILSAAQAEADAITGGARNEAEKLLQQAERDATAFSERGKKALEQAARDVIITVTDAVAGSFRELVSQDVSRALSPERLGDMLVAVVKAYVEDDTGSGKLDVLLNPEQQAEIQRYFVGRYGEALPGGVDIKGDPGVLSGFKVSLVDQEVQHDFSGEAICDALCSLLRPHLADIVRSVQQ